MGLRRRQRVGEGGLRGGGVSVTVVAPDHWSVNDKCNITRIRPIKIDRNVSHLIFHWGAGDGRNGRFELHRLVRTRAPGRTVDINALLVEKSHVYRNAAGNRTLWSMLPLCGRSAHASAHTPYTHGRVRFDGDARAYGFVGVASRHGQHTAVVVIEQERACVTIVVRVVDSFHPFESDVCVRTPRSVEPTLSERSHI